MADNNISVIEIEKNFAAGINGFYIFRYIFNGTADTDGEEQSTQRASLVNTTSGSECVGGASVVEESVASFALVPGLGRAQQPRSVDVNGFKNTLSV